MKASALPTFDAANQIAGRIRVLGIPANLLGRYMSLSSSEVCSLLNGAKKLSAIRHKQFKEMVTKLEDIAKDVAPIPVNFRDVEAVCLAIAKRERGTLLIQVTQLSPDAADWARIGRDMCEASL